MRFIETIKNIWKIEELRNRLLTTCLFVLIYRFGSFVVLPGVNPHVLGGLANQTAGGLMALLDMFSGGAFSNASIFALGIMPYISASIVVQLLTMAVPYFQKMQREGESGQRKMNQITRYLTVAILLIQGPSYLVNLRVQIAQAGIQAGATPEYMSYLGSWEFIVPSTIIMCAGSMFVMWLGERITDRGIGNGISFIILIGIIARFPRAIISEFALRMSGVSGGLIMFLLELVILLVVIGLSVMLVQGTRKIPVQYAKRIIGNRQYGGVRQYLPLKVNAANVMPIIFAQAIMFIPISIVGFSSSQSAQRFIGAFMDNTGFWYNFVFALLIIAFTYFYTAIIINPTQMAEDLKRNNGFIPGVKPGKATASYIDTIMSRITLPGSIFLAIVAILPAFASLLGISREFAQFFGGTSLLITVGVILDTLQQIESHLKMHHYDGLLKSGSIKGRTVGAY
ncbi:MAG: preprotein translocase subunit SecY [Paludibacteraceae bacterium]|nr:preprotein translocase subunit SecY [Paludibacteraceae bacterium]